jgi:catechol 2,3-dioxygenase-like lactoylglutathione lyase family enzyme
MLGTGALVRYMSHTQEGVSAMSRVQLALNVDDLDAAITFYSKLFNTEPAKVKDGYANFAIAEPPLKLVLLENPGHGGTLNHLGVEVASSDQVHAEIARLAGEGLFTAEEIGTTCCFATQDKVWVTGPAGEKWEVYTVLADSDTFGTAPEHLTTDSADSCSCNDRASDSKASADTAAATTTSRC